MVATIALPEPTWPPLDSHVNVHEGSSQCADVTLHLPSSTLGLGDSYLEAHVLAADKSVGFVGKQILLVNVPLASLVWRVSLPFAIDIGADDGPSIAKLTMKRRTLVIKGLRRKYAWIGPYLVRGLSGNIADSAEASNEDMPVCHIERRVCANTLARRDEVRLMVGATLLQNRMKLGDCTGTLRHGETLEISVAVVTGPSVTAVAMSGKRIEVLDGVPETGSSCHFDRDYTFSSLGDFASREGMRYVMTPNDDRKTAADDVMWRLDIRVPAIVYVNFRSTRHVQEIREHDWLEQDGWQLQPGFKSTVSDGYPNGPYSGPVFAKSVHPKNRQHIMNLMGSNFYEGTYFVFVELVSPS